MSIQLDEIYSNINNNKIYVNIETNEINNILNNNIKINNIFDNLRLKYILNDNIKFVKNKIEYLENSFFKELSYCLY